MTSAIQRISSGLFSGFEFPEESLQFLQRSYLPMLRGWHTVQTFTPPSSVATMISFASVSLPSHKAIFQGVSAFRAFEGVMTLACTHSAQSTFIVSVLPAKIRCESVRMHEVSVNQPLRVCDCPRIQCTVGINCETSVVLDLSLPRLTPSETTNLTTH